MSKLRQDASGAHSAFTSARVEAEKNVRAQPGNVPSLTVLALIDALLGHKEKAIQEGRAACDMLPLAKDAVVGVFAITNLARIYALTGEKDLALQKLEIVSKLPAGPSYGGVVLNPSGTHCAAIRASRKSSHRSRRKNSVAAGVPSAADAKQPARLPLHSSSRRAVLSAAEGEACRKQSL